jgi:hypothetical protein
MIKVDIINEVSKAADITAGSGSSCAGSASSR